MRSEPPWIGEPAHVVDDAGRGGGTGGRARSPRSSRDAGGRSCRTRTGRSGRRRRASRATASAVGLQQGRDALDQAVQVGDVGQHVVGDDQVGALALGAQLAREVAAEERRERRHAGRRSPPRPAPRPDRCRAPGCRARRSCAACSRRCSRSRPPASRRRGRSRSISSSGMGARVGEQRARDRGEVRVVAAEQDLGRAPSRLIWTRLQAPHSTRSSGTVTSGASSSAAVSSRSASGVAPSASTGAELRRAAGAAAGSRCGRSTLPRLRVPVRPPRRRAGRTQRRFSSTRPSAISCLR